MDEYLEFAKELAYKAGDIMKKYFFEGFDVEFKSDETPVTIADKTINNMVIDKVKKRYPEHGVDGEEAKNLNNSSYLWVVDPVDGTSGYTRHFPIAVFSLALVVDGEPVVGVVYDPFLDELFSAIKGKGAFCNDKPIHVNNTKFNELGCTIDYCMWNNMKYDTFKVVETIKKKNKISMIGSVAHACMAVASGRISGELFPGVSHGNCDMAASALIVSEAGGKVTSYLGEEQRYDGDIDGALISNGIIHDDLLEVIKKIEQ